MAKSIEHITKTWANPNNRASPAEIAARLKEMDKIVDEVAQHSQAELELQQNAYDYEVEQLALFLRESEARFGKGA